MYGFHIRWMWWVLVYFSHPELWFLACFSRYSVSLCYATGGSGAPVQGHNVATIWYRPLKHVHLSVMLFWRYQIQYGHLSRWCGHWNIKKIQRMRFEAERWWVEWRCRWRLSLRIWNRRRGRMEVQVEIDFKICWDADADAEMEKVDNVEYREEWRWNEVDIQLNFSWCTIARCAACIHILYH